MLERTSHTETVRAGTPVTQGAVILLTIERVVLRSGRGNTRVWTHEVPKKTVALRASARRIFDVDVLNEKWAVAPVITA